ncbi:histidine kinase dimerization/phosphoacceptor domain -containing protein [Skermanella pratensis]|uniref:histidine kinase dimerization/phosphoacceptor domain -containing protein n=1 Tax=Skermanella pratensis TaxID=2233999 RepID=UPI001FE5F35E|nr:histidine kinase dimerization/phosphoacceptor domain -containing protein [Skermanella pratensis]
MGTAIPGQQISEIQRLEALRRYGILDTPREEEFDDVTRLAAYVCRTPVALVSFVDANRQWFKSEVGLGASETALNASVCRLVIRQSGLFIVPDLAADGRFSDNPLVSGPLASGSPGMRFYAGALLQTADGHALGTLCVLDHEPRPGLDEEQKAALSTLARQVMSLLELRRSIQQKELMLKEVNHRVKNSLQLVSSLLRLESRQISDPVTRRHFDEACARVATIARVHERLYMTDKVGVVEFGLFLRDLCADLAHSAMVEQGHSIEVEADTHELATDKVIPLALIVNELLTNAVKYAYPQGRRGVIRVRFKTLPDGGFEVGVADEGVGLPAGFDPATTSSLGMRMVCAMLGQVGGEMTCQSGPTGTMFRIHAAG